MDNFSAPVPPALAGFEHVSRAWDPVLKRPRAQIMPGQLYVTAQDEALSTVLGSCVSACARDAEAGVGGMNHFLLPGTCSSSPDDEGLSGKQAMIRLLDALFHHGATVERLEVKVVGGGQIFIESGVGRSNLSFIFDYLRGRNIAVQCSDVGGASPRRVLYFPRTGLMRVRKLAAMNRPSDPAPLATPTQARWPMSDGSFGPSGPFGQVMGD